MWSAPGLPPLLAPTYPMLFVPPQAANRHAATAAPKVSLMFMAALYTIPPWNAIPDFSVGRQGARTRGLGSGGEAVITIL